MLALATQGGYAVDMFGRKRGACEKDDSCWRFDPPPPTAGRVLAQATCRRCGRSCGDHEDLGTKADGEPDLVDERGQAFRIRMKGGGGAHDSPELAYDLMPDFKWVRPACAPPAAASPAPAQPAATSAEEEAAALAERLRRARDVD